MRRTGDGGDHELSAPGTAGKMPGDLRTAPGGRTRPRGNCYPHGLGRAHGPALHGACAGTCAPPARRGVNRPGGDAMSYTEQERLEAAEWFIDIRDVEDPSPELLHEWMRWMETSESHRRAFAAVEQAWREAAAGL